jgi:hypothetical protein
LYFVPETKETTTNSQNYYPSDLYYEDVNLNLVKVNKIKIIFDKEDSDILSIKKYIDSKVYVQALDIFKKKRKFKTAIIDDDKVNLSSVAKYILREIREHINVSGVKLYSGNIEAQVLIT